MTSDESVHSVTRFATTKASAPFGHASQSSIVAASPAVAKKSSFASIRNAFKTSRNHDPPPVPPMEHTSPLKNPFNRSTSSLNHPIQPTRPFVSSTVRPPTPGSGESRYTRVPSATRAKSHVYAKSQHSHSGSIFLTSDPGSDQGHGGHPPSSPPPLPRVRNGFGGLLSSSETLVISDMDDDKIVMDPRTPSEYALHAVFIRFASSAELKIDTFLRQGLVCPYTLYMPRNNLNSFIGS
jgi:hypothetical protein